LFFLGNMNRRHKVMIALYISEKGVPGEEFQSYTFPDEADDFIRVVNDYLRNGYTIRLAKTSHKEMLEDLMKSRR